MSAFSNRRSERGATLTGYALTLSLITVISMGSILVLQDSGEEFLVDTGDSIGTPIASKDSFENAQQKNYGSGNSTGNGPATTTTTTPPPTAPPTTAKPPTAKSASVGLDTPTDDGTVLSQSTAMSRYTAIEVNIPVEGSGLYEVQLTNVLAENGSDNSVYIRINGGAILEYHMRTSSSTQSVADRYSDASTSNYSPIQVDLLDGETLTVEIWPREEGTRVGGLQIVPTFSP